MGKHYVQADEVYFLFEYLLPDYMSHLTNRNAQKGWQKELLSVDFILAKMLSNAFHIPEGFN